MHLVFRTDASLLIGTGHAMRCLTLADALRDHGAQSTFVCRPHDGHLLSLIAERGHVAVPLPALHGDLAETSGNLHHAAWLGTTWEADAAHTQNALTDIAGNEPLDWLVVDHYALDQRWECALRSSVRRIMVIDDLADRPHDCDLLLDQNLGRNASDYAGLLNVQSELLVGPRYALLRPEFAAMRPHSLARRALDPRPRHVLVSMGGVDKDNVTEQVLRALSACDLPLDARITVVMGSYAPWLQAVRNQAANMVWPTQVLVGVNNMAQLMAESDLAIGAAGSTSWERCCLGLPSILVVVAQNQEAGAAALEDAGAAIVLNKWGQSFDGLCELLSRFIDQDFSTKMMSVGAALVDGTGSERVMDHILRHQ